MPLFFVPIPKAAGISFWSAAMAYFGQSRILHDGVKKALEISEAGQRFSAEWQLNREPA